MFSATVANVTPRAIFDTCVRRGVDATSLLSNVGINQHLINDPATRIPLEQVLTLWKQAQKHSGDKMIGLHTAELLPFGAFRVIDYMLVASPTPRRGLERVTRYYRLINSAFEFNLWTKSDQTHFELHNSFDPKNLLRQYVEYIFANVLIRVRMVTGVNSIPKKIDFTFSAPKNISEYAQMWQAPVRFDQPVNQLVFDRRMLEIPQTQSDPLLCELFDHHAQRLLKNLPTDDSFLAQLCSVMREGLNSRNIGLTATARKIGISQRALQRRLNYQGTSYRQVLDRLRCELAISFLERRQINIDELAFHLGFSEASSFYRAFKRWTGKTPHNYRAPSPPPTTE